MSAIPEAWIEALRTALYDEGFTLPYGPVRSSDYLPRDTDPDDRPAALAALQAADAEVERLNLRTLEAILTATLPLIREAIAQAIEAQAGLPCDDFDRSCCCGSCTAHEEALDAARIARGGVL